MVKSNLLFALLLASVLVIGTFGIDIANRFLGSDSLEETVIDRSGNGLYIASPDEISFNPMEIIRNNGSYMYIEDSYRIAGTYVCSAILQCLSRGTAGAEYKYPLLESPEKAFRLSSNYYYYLKGYKYINTDGELRYADCIIDQSNNYDVIYVNFYNGEHYNLGTDKVNKGVEILEEYSKEFYPDFNDGESPILNVYNWAFSGFRMEEVVAENVEELPEKALLCYDEAPLESFGVGDNPVEIFWANSMFFCGIHFNSMLEREFEEIKAKRPYDAGYYSISNSQSTTVPISMLEQAMYEYGDELLTENTDYVAYDGRIYQTINMGDNKTVNIIYNIEEDTIEGFYFPPTIR